MPRIHWTWVFVALLVAVSLSSVSFQLVNGAVVSTEPEVRLRQGFGGLVPCTVIRKISTVNWKKEDAIETAVDVVTLDISNGHISGPGFEDGEFTIASNYSLIFKNARSTDSGRYFCEVTDYGTGSKYRNHSDVTVFDPPVITDARRVLQYGDQAILRCQYEEAIYIVQWKKGRTKDDSEVLVQIVLDRDSNRTQREFPPRYQGWYNMTDNFSLVINSTRIQDGGRYFCLVSDLATGIPVSNSTYVDVVATPKEAFPEINTCMPISTNGSVQTCEICEDRNTTITLTCTVTGYYPDISLSFSDASNMTSMTKRNTSNDSEGLLTQVVTIELFVGTEEMCGTSLVRANPVTCTASGLPFGTTRTTQGVFTPTETKGNQTDRNDPVAICVQDSSTCRHPPVITDDRRVLQYGKRENLTCQYEKPACAIYWMKGDTCADAEQLIELNLHHETSQRKGPGYDQGWYNISEDYSLVINSTRKQDRGRYFCVVSDRATGRRLVNSTYVDVVVFIPTTSGNQTNANNIVTTPAPDADRHSVPLPADVPSSSGNPKFTEGHVVSFVELWHLVSGIKPDKTDSLANAIKELSNLPRSAKVMHGMSTSESLYYLLCKWKDGYKGQNQLEDLFQCLRDHGLEDEVERLEDFDFEHWKPDQSLLDEVASGKTDMESQRQEPGTAHFAGGSETVTIR
ncbi:uncharacterized protein [Diadema setosum]|uniref:uncharacterized protein n=1 Tax=Diadema setosum TaxID=31175 RepID=UPI003B3A8F94